MKITCEKCNHIQEVTFSRGKKDSNGYLETSIGHIISKMFDKKMSKDEVMKKLYDDEKKEGIEDPSFHVGRVNRVFSERNKK